MRTSQAGRRAGSRRSAKKAAQPKTIAEIIQQHLEILQLHHTAALSNDEEAVEGIHKTRVTTRRLQAALDLLQVGANVEAARDLKLRLRKFRGALSGLRNYDVFLSILDRSVSPADSETRVELEPLRQHLENVREREVAAARRALKAFKVDSVASRIVLAAGSAGSATSMRRTAVHLGNVDSGKMRQRAAQRLTERLAEFLQLAERLKDGSDPAAVHQFRIAAKRLRYLLETLSEMGYREPRGALRWLRAAQSRIGDWHDLDALEQEVIRQVTKKDFLRGRLQEGADLLRATARIVAARDSQGSKTFPVRPPDYFGRTIERILTQLQREEERVSQMRPRIQATTAAKRDST